MIFELQELLFRVYSVQTSTTTIVRSLHRRGLTYKKISRHAMQRDEADRTQFQFIVGMFYRADQFVCVDESACDRRTTRRRYAWSYVGSRALVRDSFSRGGKYSIAPALSLDGILHYSIHRCDKFFRQPTILMRELLSTKLQRSRQILEFMYLGAKVFETFDRKPEEAATSSCSPWLTRYSSQVSKSYDTPNPYPSQQEVEDRLNGLLELAFLTFMVLSTSAGYATLRLALPNFLRLVSDDPCLWVEHERSGLLGVSLPATLISNRVEIRRFVFYDVKYSLVLGLPTLAEYDTTGFSVVPGTDIPVERVHGVPVEFLVNITEVHNWRARMKNVDWKVLEMRTLAWRWGRSDVQSEDSVQMVYRIAIQEAWRHTTLIYIYMGMCGVTSDDPRVQVSVRQIIRLMGLVEDTHLDVHFSVPSVVAGLAARYELQRALIIRKLKSFIGMRIWTLRGRDFARVLEHLWHGPAVDGAAVGWDDYVWARCKVLPIR
ncbi:unnamed protein product [Rhizoctonia solani]|uniref:Uncharacterized protein n=1 Tax=Rhizoctonia solani TaxID=456999 RepID=A0A8H3CIF7_9AGAM|nr:unnamed protein product [Rhizoctonia solani]